MLVRLTEEGERRLTALSSAHLDELHTIGPALVAMIQDLTGTL